jgi:hypothetical protein
LAKSENGQTITTFKLKSCLWRYQLLQNKPPGFATWQRFFLQCPTHDFGSVSRFLRKVQNHLISINKEGYKMSYNDNLPERRHKVSNSAVHLCILNKFERDFTLLLATPPFLESSDYLIK